jgi:hypothetical protein
MRVCSLIVVAACAAAALVSGCSSSGSAGASGASPTRSAPPIAAPAGPCAFLTPDEVHEFGDHVSYPGRPGHQDYGPTCDYGGAVFTLIDRAVSAKAFSYGATKHVAGIGDRAYYDSQWHWLRVASGQTRFELKCVLCPDPELPAMSSVARALVTRLPK